MKDQRSCICGKHGYPLKSISCPIHGQKLAINSKAYALGEQRRNGFHVRRIVWGRLLAREEKRPGEEIRRAILYVRPK